MDRHDVIISLDRLITYEAVGTQEPRETLMKIIMELVRLRASLEPSTPTQEHLAQIRANL
jgi:hypothetical protein